MIGTLVYCERCLAANRRAILGDRVADGVLLVRIRERRIMVQGGVVTLTCGQCGHDTRLDMTAPAPARC